ncbi:hypothetical protein [Streptomyces echinatus]|uniref:Uncharacterized protein n=1 Tax=Streptomyces echinatus TaxID=67293 RepID=A0A7W9Q333_9ACTN|nr:hypothetical protein [Streptomyces echinatus]MBB5932723.1 hypothetical protein [Streptomyces echinatus]
MIGANMQITARGHPAPIGRYATLGVIRSEQGTQLAGRFSAFHSVQVLQHHLDAVRPGARQADPCARVLVRVGGLQGGGGMVKALQCRLLYLDVAPPEPSRYRLPEPVPRIGTCSLNHRGAAGCGQRR